MHRSLTTVINNITTGSCQEPQRPFSLVGTNTSLSIIRNPENAWSVLYWYSQAWKHSSQKTMVILILLSLYKANNCPDEIWGFSSTLLWRMSGGPQLLKRGCCRLMKAVAWRRCVQRRCLLCFPHQFGAGVFFPPLCQICRACRVVVPFSLGKLRFSCWGHPGTSHFRRCLPSHLSPVLCPPRTVSVLDALQSQCGIFGQN